MARERGYTVVDPEVGELVTSLDMAGISLTLVYLDEELERLQAELQRLRARVDLDAGGDVGDGAAADRDRPS